MKNIHAVVYEKERCPKCKFTIQQFKQNNIPVKTITIDPSSQFGQNKINKFSTKGIKSFPIVKLYNGLTDDGSRAFMQWSDLKMDLIKKYSN